MLEVTYDPTLVIASILVAIMASFTGLWLTAGIGQQDPRERRVTIAKAAVALGSGIWSMHFVGMLAVSLPVVIVYDALPTLISVLLAILVVGLGLILLHFGVRTQLRIAAAGMLTGLGIVSMHYVGMAAMRGNCIITYDPFGVLFATGIAMAASVLALEFAYRRRTLSLIFLGATILGLTIAAMHYTAMLSTTFSIGSGVNIMSEPNLSSGTLALVVTLAAFVICGLFLLMTVPGIAANEFAAEPAEAEPGASVSSDEADSAVKQGNVTDLSTGDTALSEDFSSSEANTEPQALRIPYQQDDTIRFLSSNDVLAIRAQGHYTQILTAKGELFCSWAISKHEKNLSGLPFLRTHRSFLVNLDHVEGFRRDGDKGYCLIRKAEGADVPVSRSQIPVVQSALGLE
ncbi:MAG: MHYT domain-containing protein [Geminicoccales bacterium]